MPERVLLLGVGNIFYGDEGAGVHLLHALKQGYCFPERVTLHDGGTLGWGLVGLIASFDKVIILDAVAAVPGSLYRFSPHDIPSEISYGKLSSHEWEVPDLLTAIELHGDLPEVTLIAIGVEPIEFVTSQIGVTLSPKIEARLPAFARVVLDELTHMGAGPLETLHACPPRALCAEEIVCA